MAARAQDAPIASCAVTVQMRDYDDYYPPGALRRAEEGEAIIAFRATPGERWPRDVEIVRSSGFPALDEAALKIVRSLRVKSPCFARTVRWAVHFDYEPPEPQPRRQTGCIEIIPRGTGYVLVVPDESEIY
jgi:TonB family protein